MAWTGDLAARTGARADVRELRPVRHAVTHLAAIQGCLRVLGRDPGDAWLFGATGYAFVMNIPRGLDCAGPTCWDTLSIRERMPNLGASTARCVTGQAQEPDFEAKQRQAWELVRSSLDAGLPCYGAEFGFPEFFTIHGYDEDAILFRSLYLEQDGRKPWRELGTTDVCYLLVGNVEPLETIGDDRRTVRDALDVAIGLHRRPAGFLGTESAGLAAYDAWADAMESGEWRDKMPYGLPHNAGTWHECRLFAEAFLREAGERLGGNLRPLFAEAADHYRAVHEALGEITRLFSWKIPVEEYGDAAVGRALAALRLARAAEAGGLAVLERIRSALEPE